MDNEGSATSNDVDIDTFLAMEDIHHEIEEMAYNELRGKLSLLTSQDPEQAACIEETRREIHERAKRIAFERMQARNIDMAKAALYCICKDRKWNGPYTYRENLIPLPKTLANPPGQTSSGGELTDKSEEAHKEEAFEEEVHKEEMHGEEAHKAEADQIEGSRDKGQESIKEAESEFKKMSEQTRTSKESNEQILKTEMIEDQAPYTSTGHREIDIESILTPRIDEAGLSYTERKQIGYIGSKQIESNKPKSESVSQGQRSEDSNGTLVEDSGDAKEQQPGVSGDKIDNEYKTMLSSTISRIEEYYSDTEKILKDIIPQEDTNIESYDQILKRTKLENFEVVSEDIDLQNNLQQRTSMEEWVYRTVEDMIDSQLDALGLEFLEYPEDTGSDMISQIIHFGERSIHEEESSSTSSSSLYYFTPEKSAFTDDDLNYLKKSFGDTLILAIASTTMAYPTAPLSYFAQNLLMQKYVPEFSSRKKQDLSNIQSKTMDRQEFVNFLKEQTRYRGVPMGKLESESYEFIKMGKIRLGRGKRIKKDIVSMCEKLLIDPSNQLLKISRKIKKERAYKNIILNIITQRERLCMEVDLIKQEEKSRLYDDIVDFLIPILPELGIVPKRKSFIGYLSEFVGFGKVLSYEGPISTTSGTLVASGLNKSRKQSRKDESIFRQSVDLDKMVRQHLNQNIKRTIAYVDMNPPLEIPSQKFEHEVVGEEEEYLYMHEKICYPGKYPCQRPPRLSHVYSCDKVNADLMSEVLPNVQPEHAVYKIADEAKKRDRGQQTEDPYTKFRKKSRSAQSELPSERISLHLIEHLTKSEACAMCRKLVDMINVKKQMSYRIKLYEIDYTIGDLTKSVSVIIDHKFNAKSQEKSDDQFMLLKSIIRTLDTKLEYENEDDRKLVKDQMINYIINIIDVQQRELALLKYKEKLRFSTKIDNLFYELFVGEEDDLQSATIDQCDCAASRQSPIWQADDCGLREAETQVILEDILAMLAANLNDLTMNPYNLQRLQLLLESFITRAARDPPYLSERAIQSMEDILILISNIYDKYPRDPRRVNVCEVVIYMARIINDLFDRAEKVFDDLYLQQKEYMQLEIMKMFASLVDGLTVKKIQAQVMC